MAKFNDVIKILLIIKFSSTFAQQTRIVGGSSTTVDKIPYVVQLLKNGKFICGGTLVSQKFVVTAAHCVTDTQPSQLTIVGGASRLTDVGVRRKVSRIMIPAGFSKRTINWDVAVLKLSTPLTGKNIKPIALCTKAWNAGASLQVSGWGSTGEYSKSVSQQVRTVNVIAVAKTKCSARYRSLTATMTCASVPGRKDACVGDSGGPAIRNGQLCGVVSWGVGCARSNYPGVYTNVLRVIRFIKNSMKK